MVSNECLVPFKLSSLHLFFPINLGSSKQVTESDAVDVVEVAIKQHTSDLTTKAMSLIALLKLSSRFPSSSEYINALYNFYFNLSFVYFCHALYVFCF